MKSAPGLFGVTGRQREYIDDVLGSVDKDGRVVWRNRKTERLH